MKWVKKYSTWSLPSKITAWGFLVGVVGLIWEVFGTASSTTVKIDNRANGTVQSIVNSPNSTQSITVGERSIFAPPSTNIIADVSRKLSDFKKNFAAVAPSVSIEVESGSRERFKVADLLGQYVASQELGGFNRTKTSVGVAPDFPMTLWCGRDGLKIAPDFLASVAPYVSGGTNVAVVRDDRRCGANQMILYINGTPYFHDDGSVAVR